LPPDRVFTFGFDDFKVSVYPGDSLVRPFEAFDAVGAGVADFYHSNEQYFESKTRALNFFSAVPYGLNANELSAWIDCRRQ
jgi:TRAP-type mannitol/chloroaromatic compound transport system substrate-binding protein